MYDRLGPSGGNPANTNEYRLMLLETLLNAPVAGQGAELHVIASSAG